MPEDDLVKEEEQLIARVVGSAPNLPIISGGESDRFFQEVRALLERRAQDSWKHEDDECKSAVFVLVDFPRKPLSSNEFVLDSVVDLPATNEKVFGKIFFLSFNAGNGTKLDLPVERNGILDWLSDNGLGLNPVVIAHRDTQKLSTRVSAENDEVTWQTIRDKKPALTIDSIKEALSVFHSDKLSTPSSCGTGVWEPKRSAEYVPAKNTEKAIQMRLHYHLSGWFKGIVKVHVEDSIDMGRIDVRLLTPPGSGYGLQYWSIIELKVARSFRTAKKGKKAAVVSKKSVIDEILKGIVQAHEFTSEQEVKEGFLEVYDMRKDKSDDLFSEAKVIEKLDQCTVVVNAKLRPMFGSAEDARNNSFGAS